jgi:hypothetical protein
MQRSGFVGIANTVVHHNARAGIANFGSHVALVNTEISCCAWELEGEGVGGQDFVFENPGSNSCGCPPSDPMGGCTAESVGLDAPEPVGP